MRILQSNLEPLEHFKTPLWGMKVTIGLFSTVVNGADHTYTFTCIYVLHIYIYIYICVYVFVLYMSTKISLHTCTCNIEIEKYIDR